MGFDTTKWFKNQYLTEDLTQDISNAIPEDTGYAEFAKAVARILKDEYGSHNFDKFMEVLHSELGMGESLNEGELEDAAKKLNLTLNKKDGKIEVGGDAIDKDEFEGVAKKLGYKVDREVEKGEYDRLYISK